MIVTILRKILVFLGSQAHGLDPGNSGAGYGSPTIVLAAGTWTLTELYKNAFDITPISSLLLGD